MKHRWTVGHYLAVAVAAAVLYALSAPALMGLAITRDRNQPSNPFLDDPNRPFWVKAIEVYYVPIKWLYQHCEPLREPLDRYESWCMGIPYPLR